jgi:hypothetical protein
MRAFGNQAMRLALLGLVALGGCIVNVRGFSEFERSEGAQGISALVVELPRSGVSIVGARESEIRWRGRWWALGPSAAEAQNNADAASWRLEIDLPVARLAASIPLAIEGLVEVELDRLSVPEGVDVTVLTESGDVEATGLRGHFAAVVESGDLQADVEGSVSADIGDGEVDVQAGSHVDIRSDGGDVRVAIDAVGDVIISAETGDVEVHLADDRDLDVLITAGGRIEVDTAQVAHVGERELRRAVGDADVRLWIEAPGGSVRVDDSLAGMP